MTAQVALFLMPQLFFRVTGSVTGSNKKLEMLKFDTGRFLKFHSEQNFCYPKKPQLTFSFFPLVTSGQNGAFWQLRSTVHLFRMSKVKNYGIYRAVRANYR